jgi:hypothetical protein
VSYTIDPNSGTMTAPSISITNNSQHIGVSVTVQTLKSTGINDVAPNAIANWNALTASQTASEMAFGIGVKETAPASGGWASISNSGTLYASNVTSPVLLGVLGVGGTGNLQLSADFGLAWANQTTVTQNLTLMFTACDVS